MIEETPDLDALLERLSMSSPASKWFFALPRYACPNCGRETYWKVCPTCQDGGFESE